MPNILLAGVASKEVNSPGTLGWPPPAIVTEVAFRAHPV